MRRHILSILLVALCLTQGVWAQSPKTEFRATWIATVANIDWPSTKVTTTGNTSQINQQKSQLTTILDALQAGNIHAVCLQVRPTSDAFYPSALSPWSEYLTGTRGKNPGYDPLAFAIEEAHKRGMELHAWFNPFRYERNSTSFGNVDLRASHPEWIISYNNGSFNGTILDPGQPAVRQYLKQVIGELIANYDIDGILADDYFYPYGGTTNEDATSKAQYKPSGMSDGDWRRQNVNQTIEGLYDTIQAVKPWVRFGMAPFGIWTTQSSVAQANGLTLPQGITGSDAYSQLNCDPVAWIKNGYIDYISPQIYWPTTSSGQNYTKLCQWWGQQVCKHFSDLLPNGKKVHLFVSHNDYGDWVTVEEEGLQVDANRQYCPFDAPGSIFYNTSYYRSRLVTGMKNSKFQNKSLPPAMSWKSHPTLAAPTNLALNGTTLSWQHPTAERFTVYAYPKGTDQTLALENSLYLLGIVYGKQMSLSGVSNLSNMTIAVRALDRYGNEFEAATLNAAEPEPPVEPEDGALSRVELWRKTAAQLGVMTDNSNHSMAYYDGKLYLADGGGKFHKLNASTGAVEQTVTISGLASNFCGHNLRVTEDGMMLLGNSAAGTSTYRVYTNTLTGTTPTLAATYSESFGRSDYFYPFGSFSSNGYVLMLSNTNKSLMKITYSNGSVTSNQVIDNASLPASTSAKAIPADSETFFASVAGVPATRHNVQTGALVDSWTGSVKPALVNASGVAYFKLGGHEYLLAPADVKGAISTFDITGGMANATELLTATEALGESSNAPFTVDFAVDVQGYDAYVYVLAPNNGVAAYKYTFTPESTGVQTAISSQPSAVGKVMTPEGLRIIVGDKTYTPLGVMIQ